MSAGQLGISEATRSPGFSPRPSKLTARRSLRSSSVRHVQRVSAEISASPSGLASRPARSRSYGLTGLANALPAYPVTLPPPERDQHRNAVEADEEPPAERGAGGNKAASVTPAPASRPICSPTPIGVPSMRPTEHRRHGR